MTDVLKAAAYRLAPHGLEVRLRERWDDPKMGVTHWVELSCPETDGVMATEETEPVDVERDVEGGTGIWTYECQDCGDYHRFLWGPPAPIYVGDEYEGDVPDFDEQDVEVNDG